MSLLEVERMRRKKQPHARRKKQIPHSAGPLPALAPSDPHQILTLHEWCRLNRISERTGRRILAGDNGPVVTQLANWRVGITVGNNALWQRSRERASNNTQPRRRPRRQAQERA